MDFLCSCLSHLLRALSTLSQTMERTILAMFVFFCIALQYFPTATVVATASCPNIKSRSSVELPDLYEASISELQAGLQAGAFTSVDLVTVCYKMVIIHEIKQ